MPAPPIHDDSSLRKRLERHLDDLPVLPTVVGKLLALDQSADDYFEQVLSLIGAEPNFAARVLAVANSGCSAPRTPITALGAAISSIGCVHAAYLALAVGVTRVFVPRDTWEKGLWRHGLETAQMASALAARVGDPEARPEDAYSCGLLHDIGRFVMFQEAPAQLRLLDEGDWGSPEAVREKELEICGLSHAELGAMACERWKLPSTLTEVVRFHHDPPASWPEGRTAKLLALVSVAEDALPPDEADPDSRWTADTTRLGLTLDDAAVHAVFARAAAEAEARCEALGVA
jgi:putative nucleotidyltransferase with HDIG domain